MRRVDGNLMIICAGLTVACCFGSALAVAVYGIEIRSLVGIGIVTAVTAASAVAMVRIRERGFRSRLSKRMAQAIESSGGEHSQGSPADMDEGEFSSVLERIQLLHARLRDETVARQVGSSRSEELLSVLQALEDPVFVFDRFGAIRLANAAADELTSSEVSFGGADIRTIFSDGPLGELLRSGLEEGSVAGRAIEVEYDLSSVGGGSNRVFDVRTLALGEEASGPFVLVMRDLTREREISRMKSDFVSKASHELRTPLASIRGYLEMIVDGETTDEAHKMEFLRSMLDDTERLSSLVENMLNISRIEAGMVRPQLERSDLGEIARHVALMLEPAAGEKDISISVAAVPVDLWVEGDTTMLQEVVLNLTTNAIKYTPNGGRVTISVDTDPLERSVLVAVADTGLGIPPEARERVFEKFFRVPSYERMAQGTGLGLNLCRNIVESVHRGRIGVDSTMGEGSRFWFSIPMRFAGARAA